MFNFFIFIILLENIGTIYRYVYVHKKENMMTIMDFFFLLIE